jgi:hypothetical protein
MNVGQTVCISLLAANVVALTVVVAWIYSNTTTDKKNL